MDAIYEHAKDRELPPKDIASWAIQTSYPGQPVETVKAWANQVLCMIAEYHLACVLKGPKYASPILPEALENYLPPRDDYTRTDCTDSTTDVRIQDNKARTLRVRVWLHHLDTTLGWDKEAAESLLQSKHT